MRRDVGLAVTILTLGLLLSAGCARQPAPLSPGQLETIDYASLVTNLRLLGATVELRSGPSPDEVFSAASRGITINGEEATVLEFVDEATAQSEARLVQPDGSGFGPQPVADGSNRIVQWSFLAPPHWYRSGRIIVRYVGENQATKDLLKGLLGGQFAGM